MITEAEVRKVYDTAPANLKEYVDSDEVFNAFHEIRRKYALHIDHAGNLAMVINAVILGIYSFQEMPQLMREALQGVADDVREQVLADINEKIFIPLRNLSKKHAEEVEKKTIPQASIRNIEVSLAQAPNAPLRPASVAAVAPPEPPVPAPAPAVPPVSEQRASAPAPTVSVIAEKLNQTSAPAPVPQQVAPQPAPNAPVKYHGADPYKEPIE